MREYSQMRAMLAITRASLKATFRSPQSVFFSLFFPVVLVWIFGALGKGGGGALVDVAFDKHADSTNMVYLALKSNPFLHFEDPKTKDIEDDLLKGRITAIIDVQDNTDTASSKKGRWVSYPPLSIASRDSTIFTHQQHRSNTKIHLRTSSASQKDFGLLNSLVQNMIDSIDREAFPNLPTSAVVQQSMMPGGRKYRMIDFILPGMIGFSLIGASVFGIAFTIYSLRETLVLKRMYSTPVKRIYIILGECLAKVSFQLLTVVILIAFGYYMYQFRLAHGGITFINMLVMSFLALLVFMGFGFLITALARNQNVIPIYANLFMFPQYFLSGTFFNKSALPEWLQPIIKFLPLTAVNDAMRNIAFEGNSLAQCWPQMLILLVWGLIVYGITAKIFRWE